MMVTRAEQYTRANVDGDFASTPDSWSPELMLGRIIRNNLHEYMEGLFCYRIFVRSCLPSVEKAHQSV